MGSFTENIDVDFDIQPKKKEKRHWKSEQRLKNPMGAKTFDLSSKNNNVKKRHLCNSYFIIKKRINVFFSKISQIFIFVNKLFLIFS